MDAVTIIKVAGTVLGSVAISGISIWWFIKLAANTLADKYKNKISHDFEKKLESYKSQLEVLRATSLKYNDKQFELYIDLWKNLQDLKFAMIDLWNVANNTNLRKFDSALKKTHRQVETTSILLEDNHYISLINVISELQEYDTGKGKLIAARRENVSDFEIQQLIEYNRERKNTCLNIIESMKFSIKKIIKGNDDVYNIN